MPTEREMGDPSEADVKAAREVLRGLYAYPPHSTVQALAAALASARAEGEAAGLERAANWLESKRILRSGTHANGCGCSTCGYDGTVSAYAKSLRALTPEGKR